MRKKHPFEGKEAYQRTWGLRSVKTVNEVASSTRFQQTAGNRTAVSFSEPQTGQPDLRGMISNSSKILRYGALSKPGPGQQGRANTLPWAGQTQRKFCSAFVAEWSRSHSTSNSVASAAAREAPAGQEQPSQQPNSWILQVSVFCTPCAPEHTHLMLPRSLVRCQDSLTNVPDSPYK